MSLNNLTLNRFSRCVLGISLLILCGCSGVGGHPYGAVEDGARSSLNGLGIHRKMWEQAGAKCLVPRRLSNRLESVDVIVLVGTSYAPPGREAREWLEQWLSEQPGRTVVYFGRDFNAQQYYLTQTLSQVPADEFESLQLDRALIEANELNRRVESYSENLFCNWFYVDTTLPLTTVTNVRDYWSEELNETKVNWPIRTRLMPPSSDYRQQLPSWIAKNGKPPTTSEEDLTVIGPDESDSEEKSVFRSRWSQREIGTRADWDAEFEDLLYSQVLLESEQGDPLVFQLTSDSRLGSSQILIVANGAPFLNGTLVQPEMAAVGKQIIDMCLPAERVALMAFNDTGLQIALTDEADAKGLGFEMFLQWPLSIVTMSACVMGLVLCVSLLPILGRPRELPQRSVSDFGMHIEAMGQLLHEAEDHQFARNAVADYFRKVRKEPPPQWLGTTSGSSTTQA